MYRMTCTYILYSTPLLRDGVQRMLDQTHYRVVGAGRCPADLKLTARRRRPDVLILIVGRLVDEVEEMIRAILNATPEARIVLLTPPNCGADVLTAFRLGASGYLVDTISADALLKSLDVIMADGIVLPLEARRELFSPTEPSSARANGISPPHHVNEGVEHEIEVPAALLLPLARPSDIPTLSDRESLILRSLIKGDSNKHIARELDIAEATVKVHVKAILRKIRVRNRTQAAIWAVQNGEEYSRPPAQPAAALLVNGGGTGKVIQLATSASRGNVAADGA